MLQVDPLSPGLRLGRYELIQRLAVGGMAEIYLARATGIEGFEKLVVLKRILPQFARNEGFVSMFLDEARLSATLQHPNIAQVYDIGQHDGSYFFTMEYVRGEDVRTLLKTSVKEKRRIPLSLCIKIIADACAGLHAAHEKCGMDGEALNIIHRDVSPSNVIVSYEGAVKLLDFGVAKAAQRQTETRSGTLKGKVSYMSPEQCRGRDLDRRSDIFALGILLYELTLRRRLFKAESEFEVMTNIVKHDVEPPSKRFPKYPKQLELILMKALRRDRDERYATAQEMQEDLEDFASRNRLRLSNVRLGKFMAEMFVDRMREIDSAITRRPRTEELIEQAQDEELIEQAQEELIEQAQDEDSGGSFPEIEIDTGDRERPTTVGSGLAKPEQRVAEETPVAGVSTGASIEPAGRRGWALAAVVAVAAAVVLFVVMQNRAGSNPPHDATKSVVPRPTAQPTAAAPRAGKAAPKPVVKTGGAAEKTATEAATRADTETETETGAATGDAATGNAATGKRPVKPKHKAVRRHVRRVRRRPYRVRHVHRSKPKPKLKKHKKRTWELDSPLPPPQ